MRFNSLFVFRVQVYVDLCVKHLPSVAGAAGAGAVAWCCQGGVCTGVSSSYQFMAGDVHFVAFHHTPVVGYLHHFKHT